MVALESHLHHHTHLGSVVGHNTFHPLPFSPLGSILYSNLFSDAERLLTQGSAAPLNTAATVVE